MKFNILKSLSALAVAAIAFSSCKKTDQVEGITTQGQTVVKIMDAGPTADPGSKLLGIDFVNTSQTISILDVRRDVPNSTEMNKPMTVTVKVDTQMLRIVNDTIVANGGDPYLIMPSSWYTSVPSFTWGGTFNLDFAAGELAKQVKLTINDATQMDPSATYAFPFTITSVSPSDAKISASKSFIMVIGAKNFFDGRYKLTFANYHPSSNPGYTGAETEVHLVTTGGNKCKIFWVLGGDFGNPAVLGGNLSWFGAQEPEYTVNTETYKVTVQNAYSGATTFYTMNSSYDSHYDPDTKEIFAKWGYSYAVPGVFDPACREWTQHFEYLGPR